MKIVRDGSRFVHIRVDQMFDKKELLTFAEMLRLLAENTDG